MKGKEYDTERIWQVHQFDKCRMSSEDSEARAPASDQGPRLLSVGGLGSLASGFAEMSKSKRWRQMELDGKTTLSDATAKDSQSSTLYIKFLCD